jgi:predicted porin
VEDLGGGLKAIFTLENGFDVDTGKTGLNNRLFGRQAYVGLQGTYGVLTLGRHMTPMFDYAIVYDPMVTYGRYSSYEQDPSFAGRADNSIKYTGTFGGWTASALYSFGVDSTVTNGSEVPGEWQIGRMMSASVRYANGPLSVGTIYEETNIGTTTAAPDARIRRASVAGTYQFGALQAIGGYRWAKAYDGAALPGAVGGLINQTSNYYWAGVNYRVTNALSVIGAAYYQDFRKTGSDPWLLVAQADYVLSARTDLYAVIGYTLNKSGSTLGVNGFGTTTPGSNQLGAVIGMRHKF